MGLKTPLHSRKLVWTTKEKSLQSYPGNWEQHHFSIREYSLF